MQQIKRKENTPDVELLIPLHFTFTFCFATFAYYFSLNSSLPSVRFTGIMLLFTFLRSIIFIMTYL